MTEDDWPAAGAGRARPVSGDGGDDWFGGQSEFDWSGDGEVTVEQSAPPARREQRRARPPAGAAQPNAPLTQADLVHRRRMIAVIAIIAVGAIIVLGALILSRGGSGTSAPPAPTTPLQTTTAPLTTTTTPHTTTTTQTTTTPSTSGSGTAAVVLPAAGKVETGDSGDSVKQVQQALTTVGFSPGPVDGTFGPQTKAAVVAFQQANGLTTDGIVGPKTAAALNSAVASGAGTGSSTSSSTSSSTGTNTGTDTTGTITTGQNTG
jgi:Putative peptidoglycan binding domain